MNLLHALRIFVRVVETGSFSAVAREAASSQSSVTRVIEQLEEHFGIRLLHRTTRRLSLTDDGESLLCQARDILVAAQEMEATLGHRKALPTGRVRVGLPSELAIQVTSRLTALLRRYPELSVELVIGERFSGLVEDRLDLAVQTGRSDHASAIARAISTVSQSIVAAPVYLQEHGVPQQPEDLAGHRCLVREAGPDSNQWRFTGPSGPVDVRVAGPLLANSATTIHRAALAGCGIACLAEQHLLDDIRAGRLSRLLPSFIPEHQQMFVIYPSRRHVPPRTRVLIDFFVAVGRDADGACAHRRRTDADGAEALGDALLAA